MNNIQYLQQHDLETRRKRFESHIKNGRTRKTQYGSIWSASKERDEIIMEENIRKYIFENNLL